MSIDVELNEQIAVAADRFLPSRFPIKPVGPWPAVDEQRAAWQELIALGWPFVLANEHGSTQGASQIDAIFRALGRNPVLGPAVDTFVGLPLVWRAAEAELQSSLEPHLAGERLVSCAHQSEDANGVVKGDLWSGVALKDGALDGHKTLVDGHGLIDDLLVFATEDGEPVIALVETAAKGLRSEAMITPDLSRQFAFCNFAGVPAKVIVRGDRAREVGKAFEVLARLATVSELAGIAQASLAMTVDYAKLRKQFGRTIGSFQAIKHILAEAKMNEYNLACVATRLSEELEDGSEPDGGALSAMRALCSATRTAQTVLDHSLQAHGGIGFTLEYNLSWFYNRAAGLWGLWGDPNRLALEIAARRNLERGQAA